MVRRPRQQINAFHLGSMDNEPSIYFWGFLGRPGAPVFGLIRSESAGKHMETTSFAYVFPNRSIHTSYGGPPEGSQLKVLELIP